MEARSERAPSRRELLAIAGLGLAATGCRARDAAAPPEGLRTERLIYDERGGLMVEALVDGVGPVRMVLDTGAAR